MDLSWAWLIGIEEHLVTILMFVLTLVFAATLLGERRSPGSTIAWLLTIVLVPYFGIPLYLFVGSRKIAGKDRKRLPLYPAPGFGRTPASISIVERLLLASGAPAPSSGNQIEVISDGVAAFERLMELIDSAKTEINVATFVLGRDEVAARILERLETKARAGVKVRFLLDGFGAALANRSVLKRLGASGVKAASFLPLWHMPFHGHSNLRNHRKIVVVDGSRALAGGMNIAHEYLGPAPADDRWEDLLLCVKGPLVSSLDAIFRADWQFATGEPAETPVPDAGTLPTRTEGSGAIAQVVASGPDVANDSIYDGILTAIFEARERIWISTPYFIPDETLTRALELACRRGVDVCVLVPGRSNHWLPDLGRSSYLRQLEESGARVLLHPRMVHAKATIIDQRCAIVGSANTDIRSFFFNYEVCVFLYSRAEIDTLAAWFARMTRVSVAGYPKGHWGSHWIDGVCRILSPLL